MAQFNWKSDGEDTWNESDWTKKRSPRRPRRRWPTFMAFLLLVIVVGIVFYRQVGDRVNAVTSAVTDDLMSSYQLVWYAIAQGDRELFDTLLSGRDSGWTETQRQLFSEAIIYDRAFWGLQLDMSETSLEALAAGDPSATEVQFSPDLLEAEIMAAMPYTVTTPASGQQTVTLQQSAVFRRGQDRWLMAPPGDDYWGMRVRQEGTRLTLDYPRRDAEVASRLAHDLDDILGQLCRQVADLECSQDMRVSLRLDTDPESLLFSAKTAADYPNLRLVLPTVGLVGTPVDEAGYQALYRAYARQLVAAVVAQQVGWQCCAHTSFYEALLANQLSQLDLQPWPIGESDYVRLIDQGISLEELNRIWFVPALDELDRERQWQVYVMMDFLLETFAQQSAADMQRQLVSRRTLYQWLTELYADLLDPERSGNSQVITHLQDTWWQLAYQKAIAEQGPAPIPLPTQEVQITCYNEVNPEKERVYRYQWESRQWSELAIEPGTSIMMNTLPDDSGVLISHYVYDEEDENGGRWHVTLWRGQSRISLSSGEDSLISLGQMEPTGRFATVYAFDNVEGDGRIQALLVDLAECIANECQSAPIVGPAIWSPDGRHTLVTEIESLGLSPVFANQRTWWYEGIPPDRAWRIYRGNEQATGDGQLAVLTELGMGAAPFWLDEVTYGYVRTVRESSFFPAQELVIASITEDEPEVILDSASLIAALAGDESQIDWFIKVAVASPLDPELLFLYVNTTRRDVNSRVVTLDRRTGQIETLLDLPDYEGGSLGFSPDGRWLVVLGYRSTQSSGADEQTYIVIHDIGQNQTRRLPSQAPNFPSGAYDWSIDGQWLLIIVDDKVLKLVAPQHDYEQYLFHGLGTCTEIAWITP